MPQPLPKPCSETTKPFPYREGANGFATRPPLETPPAASGQVGADLDGRNTERGSAALRLRCAPPAALTKPSRLLNKQAKPSVRCGLRRFRLS
jgi:hypothetical protein